MAALWPRADPPDKETMEILRWLWETLDRITGNRNAVLDIKGIMNLVNMLLIPRVAFPLANREAIFEAISEPTAWTP